jgi:hypothetical protein
MRIQTIEMSVPVGADSTDDEQSDDQFSTDNEQLEWLVSAFTGAHHKCHLFAWSAKAKAAQLDQFEREIKGIVKRWATVTTDAIADRNTRKQLRVRIYQDLMLFAHEVIADMNTRRVRQYGVRYWCAGIIGVAVFTTAAVTATL